MAWISSIAKFIDRINLIVGRLTGWFTTGLVLLISIYVLMRYAFDDPRLWMQELEWHFFALIFLLGAAYTFQTDSHVRVDVFYARFSSKGKAWVNLIGILLFLLPFCWVVISRSWEFVISSWEVNERSADPGGLAARYIIKAAIPVGFSLLMLQGIGEAIKAGQQLMGGDIPTEIKA